MKDQFYLIFKEWFEKMPPCGESSLTIHNKIISLKTSIGSSRSVNEDRAAFVMINNHLTNNKNIAISILADGMGGMASGEIAASTAIASFIAYIAFNEHHSGLKDMCRKAVYYSNDVVKKLLNGRGGATLSAIVYGENGCVGVNIGDSRIYYYDNFNLQQLSVDDTISGQLANKISENWENPSIGDNRLAQFIGTPDDLVPHTIDLTKYSKKISKGIFLLTSDGTHYIGKKMIEQTIKPTIDNNQIANRIVNISEWLSGHDNSTIVVCPNKLTMNRITTDINAEDLEQITIYSINMEKTYLIPKHNIKFQISRQDTRIENFNKPKFESKTLFKEEPVRKRNFKNKSTKDSGKKKSVSEKNDKVIIDLLPPEKKN